jgi:predicted nucleic acid-binding protein
MIVLDTNVLSEIMRPPADRSPAVFDWMAARPGDDLYTTAITTAELLAGVAVMPDGRRKSELERGIVRMATLFDTRILPFDHVAAHHYADLRRVRRLSGRPVGAFDAQIAAIARANRMSVATRNVKDFADCGVDLINPWEG